MRSCDISDKIILLILIFAFINLFQLHYIYILILLPFLILLNQTHKVSRITLLVIFTFFFLAINMIMNGQYDVAQTIKTTISSIAAFISGIYIVHIYMDDRGIDNRKINTVLLCISLAMVVYGALCRFITAGIREDVSSYTVQYQNFYRTKTFDFWSKKEVHYTAVSQYFIPILCLGYFSFTQKKKLKYILLLVILAVLYISLSLGSRTGVYLALLILFFNVFYCGAERRIKKKKFITVSLVILIIVLLVLVNMDDIIALLKNTTLGYRLVNSSLNSAFDFNQRFEVYGYIFKEMWKYPIGGIPGYFGEGTSSHNQFINFLQLGGFFPALLYLAFVILSSAKLIKLEMNSCDRNENLAVRSLFLGAILLFMVEAPFSSNQLYNNFFMILCGIINEMPYAKEIRK